MTCFIAACLLTGALDIDIPGGMDNVVRVIEYAPDEWDEGSDRRTILEVYYAPAPDLVEGWATRYGPDSAAVDELRWTAREALSQYEHADYVMPGGGYGYQMIEGAEYLIINRASQGFGIVASANVESPQVTNENQRRLLTLAQMSEYEFLNHVAETYVGVISTRSPNDIGREFCLIGENGLVGLVIVGNTAALHDYTPLYGRDDPLGEQHWQGQHWVADLPNDLYSAAGGSGGPVFVRLTRPPCKVTYVSVLDFSTEEPVIIEDVIVDPPTPQFVCPALSCAPDVIIAGLSESHFGVDLRVGEWAPTFSPVAGLVTFAGIDYEFNYGGMVEIRMSDGWLVRMAHCIDLRVVEGQEVFPGDLVCYIGNSGYTRDGAHLHIEVYHGADNYNILTAWQPQELVEYLETVSG